MCIRYRKSNDYRYKEWILGGYAQYKKTIKKIDFILGSRVESNFSEGINSKNSYTLSHNKTNFFPFFSISYNHSQTNNFNVSYSKRITRPTFNNLMPFNYYVDPNTILVGNPNLKPSISHQFELQYILKQNYVFAIDYSINKNEIFQTPLQNNEILSTILTPLNIKNGNSLSFSNNSTFDLFKWWNLNFNIVMFYDTIKSSDDFLSINSYNWSNQFTTTNLFTFPNNFNLEIVNEYISPFIQGPYKTNYLFSLNSSISKTFLSKRLKASITANDILGTYKLKSTSIILDQYSFIFQKFDTKWIRFSITYKLTKGIKKQIIEADSINEEIKSRTK
ncbi:outer membrane beta-barrel family protein [Flavobacterium sp. UGB4466]|uniref:outer membrane beta-barrel family protein n=1 Tax=Flavobacterium sp. UGB4466 TaxID=2730889 RepID=UPI001ED8CA47|nr:outer membrane beta-barrel family protein [Flavobacterium sp. UGB4466]